MSAARPMTAVRPGHDGSTLGALLRDRGALTAGVVLLVVAAVAWLGVLLPAAGMAPTGSMLPVGPGTIGDAAMFTLMWGVMMAAMMLPSAIPMIALYALVTRSASPSQPAASAAPRALPTALFATTYLAIWLALGVPVYLGSLAIAALAGPDGPDGVDGGSAPWLVYALALVLVAAGAYQFTPVKRVCLKHCQTPLGFLMERWRAGYANTLRIGLAHAAYCVGCCWGLMLILVAAGAMSLPWVLLIAAVVFAEKLVPGGEWTARGVGIALILLGAAVAVHPALAVALRGGAMAPMAPMPPMPM